MSIEAAKNFINAAKATREHYSTEVGKYYKNFVAGDHTPTSRDAEALEHIVDEMQKIAKVYHADVPMAVASFGGPADTTIHNAKTLLETIKKKVAEAASHGAAAASGSHGSGGASGSHGPAGASHH